MMNPEILNEPTELKAKLEAHGIKRWHISVSYAIRKLGEDFRAEDMENGGFTFFIYGTLADAISAAKALSVNMFKLPEGFKGGSLVLISHVQKRSKFTSWLLGDYRETTVYGVDYNSQTQAFEEKTYS